MCYKPRQAHVWLLKPVLVHAGSLVCSLLSVRSSTRLAGARRNNYCSLAASGHHARRALLKPRAGSATLPTVSALRFTSPPHLSTPPVSQCPPSRLLARQTLRARALPSLQPRPGACREPEPHEAAAVGARRRRGVPGHFGRAAGRRRGRGEAGAAAASGARARPRLQGEGPAAVDGQCIVAARAP
jgi:hypothetical protein